MVKQRKRLENGEAGRLVQAVNMLSGDKCVFAAPAQALDDEDIPRLERILSSRVDLASSDVSIII